MLKNSDPLIMTLCIAYNKLIDRSKKQETLHGFRRSGFNVQGSFQAPTAEAASLIDLERSASGVYMGGRVYEMRGRQLGNTTKGGQF